MLVYQRVPFVNQGFCFGFTPQWGCNCLHRDHYIFRIGNPYKPSKLPHQATVSGESQLGRCHPEGVVMKMWEEMRSISWEKRLFSVSPGKKNLHKSWELCEFYGASHPSNLQPKSHVFITPPAIQLTAFVKDFWHIATKFFSVARCEVLAEVACDYLCRFAALVHRDPRSKLVTLPETNIFAPENDGFQ